MGGINKLSSGVPQTPQSKGRQSVHFSLRTVLLGACVRKCYEGFPILCQPRNPQSNRVSRGVLRGSKMNEADASEAIQNPQLVDPLMLRLQVIGAN